MFPLAKEEIEKLECNNLELLSELDSKGLLFAPEEGIDAFKKRISTLYVKLENIFDELKNTGQLKLFDDLTFEESRVIPPEIMRQAGKITERIYAFSVDWVPGFFLSHNLGLLWGGCAISIPEENVSVFMIRKDFADAEKWFIYRRDELLSHELCHIARTPLNENSFEEHFAYKTSYSPLRRYLGNCFQSSLDAIIFILPVMLLALVETLRTLAAIFFNIGQNFPIWYFWIFALFCPLFLLFRNHFLRSTYLKAEKNLQLWGCVNPAAILFRCTKNEIFDIARLHRNSDTELSEYISSKVKNELRWKIIDYRFIRNVKPEESTKKDGHKSEC